MSHPFGDLVSQHLHRKHGLSQSKLAAGILQPPAVITAMCKGKRLTGPRARERVLAIIGWLHKQGALTTLDEANALLNAAGMASLNVSAKTDAAIFQRLGVPSRLNPSKVEVPPAPLLIAPEYPLIGRQAEWQTLRSAWEEAKQGNAHFVCIAGEAGIGKTRLAEELLSEVQGQGHVVAHTRAYALEGRLAYAPVADWLRSSALAVGVRKLDAVWRSELARLLPELLIEDAALIPPKPLTERWQRKNFFEALLRAFNAKHDQPLLLVLDDLQWCDFETLEWLQYVLGVAPHLKLLLLGTVRDTELDTDHPLHKLWRDLTRDGQLTNISLLPLSETETANLGAAVAQHTLHARDAAQLFHESAGNPLFVIESVRSQQGEPQPRGSLAPAASPHASVALPPKVYAVIQNRLAQLTPEARALAELAAVIGRAFTLTLLSQASGRDDAAVAQGVDELWQRRLVREQDAVHYDFSHDRIRDVAYAEITPAKRRVLHRAVAQALEQLHVNQLNAVNGELAEHYLQAGELERALAYSREAAAVAQRLYAHGEVIRYIEKAIGITHMAPENPAFRAAEIDLWHELGFVRIMIHDWASGPVGDAWLKSYTLATQRGSAFQQGRAAHALAMVACNRGQWREARNLNEAGLPIANSAGNPELIEKAIYSYAVSLYHFGEFERALSYSRQSLELSDASQVKTVWSRGDLPRGVLIRIAKCLWMLGFPDQARAAAGELLATARAYSNPMARFGAFDFAAMLYTFLRDIDGVSEMSEELAQISTKHDYPFYIRAAQMYRGWALAHRGDPGTGAQLVRESVNVHRDRGIRMFEPYWRALLAEALALAGETEEAMSEVDAALNFANECGNTYWSAHLLKLKGDCLLALGASEIEIETGYQQSLALARGQGAKSLELRAAMALARLWQKQDKCIGAHALLSEIYNWFTEGFDTADLREAKALLDQ